jgi:arginine-tRNA-protein transferase
VEFSAPTDKAHELTVKMVAIIDVVDDGISAVYTFYEPEAHASYGTYCIMWLIEQARKLRLPHVYLGYWIRSSSKMSYKTRFRPHELLQDGEWIRPDA